MSGDNLLGLIETSIVEFCRVFLKEPYTTYTEHGLHAQFYHCLLEKMQKNNPKISENIFWKEKGVEICRVQKEYRTASKLTPEKSRRQNWDIAVISEPCVTHAKENDDETHPYDYLELHSVIEFGLNEYAAHLEDDINRVSSASANILRGKFIVHLVRINENFSGRDRSPRSVINELTEKMISGLTEGKNVTVYLCKVDLTGKLPLRNELWLIKNGKSENLLKPKL